jgi:Ca2+-transporting ATPase
VTVTLALGVRKMARRNALVRRLPSVETLGCASVICTDKTGTLTRNEMTVRSLWVDGRFIDVTGAGYAPGGRFLHGDRPLDPKESRDLILALEIGVLCNNASLLSLRKDVWEIAGDPTEGALLAAAGKAGLWKDSLEADNPALGEVPFDSDRKRMSVLRCTRAGPRLFLKGAPDVLLKRSDAILAQGRVQTLTAERRADVESAIAALAGRAFRVLAVAYRDVENGRKAHVSLEEKLTFVGLAAMSDSPRPEAKAAVAACRRAGILPVMITGDHKATAVAVARELGILGQGQRAVDGAELDALDEAGLARDLRSIAVYARVSAAHKLRVVRAWKKTGEICAMTGDGVNDAPALKEADIGVAMGLTGTDVTKESADMVVTDDNFASLVAAVEEGRAIYDNILKFVAFLLSTNIAEVLLVLVCLFLGLQDIQGHAFVALSAVQLLWLNLLTDGLPAVALGLDPAGSGVMNRPPRRPSEPVLSGGLLVRVVGLGLLVAAGALAAAFPFLDRGAAAFQTMAMTALVCLEMVQIHSVRSAYGTPFFSNPWLMAALVSSLGLQLTVVYVPFLQRAFGTAPLDAGQWGFIGGVTLAAGTVGRLVLRPARRAATE